SFSKFKLKVDTTADWRLKNRASTLVWDPAELGSLPAPEALHGSGPQNLYGNFLYDLEHGQYHLSWSSLEEFQSFLAQEEASKSIELQKASSNTGAQQYLEQTVYVCACYGTGGSKIYNKK
ncbi:hypothetical protein BJ912DRAFT_829268, partial [Pholiota molesta]